MIQGAILVDITPKSADKERGRRELSARGSKMARGKSGRSQEAKKPRRQKKP